MTNTGKTVQKSTVAPTGPKTLSVDAIRPLVDFAAYWRVDGPQWYRYLVPSHHLLLVESGMLRARTSSGIEDGAAGDLFCLRLLDPNEYGYFGRTSYYECHVSLAAPPHEKSTLNVDGATLPEHVHLGDRYAAVRAAFELMCLNISRSDTASQLRTKGAVYELLSHAISAGQAARRVEAVDVWQRARQILESDLGEPLAVPDVARQLQIGADRFIRGFRRRFGITPMAFRNQVKLRWAASRLTAGNRMIKEVSHAAGFADTATFARAFRRLFGLSPSAYATDAAACNARLPEIEPQFFGVNRHIRRAGERGKEFMFGLYRR